MEEASANWLENREHQLKVDLQDTCDKLRRDKYPTTHTLRQYHDLLPYVAAQPHTPEAFKLVMEGREVVPFVVDKLTDEARDKVLAALELAKADPYILNAIVRAGCLGWKRGHIDAMPWLYDALASRTTSRTIDAGEYFTRKENYAAGHYAGLAKMVLAAHSGMAWGTTVVMVACVPPMGGKDTFVGYMLDTQTAEVPICSVNADSVPFELGPQVKNDKMAQGLETCLGEGNGNGIVFWNQNTIMATITKVYNLISQWNVDKIDTTTKAGLLVIVPGKVPHIEYKDLVGSVEATKRKTARQNRTGSIAGVVAKDSAGLPASTLDLGDIEVYNQTYGGFSKRAHDNLKQLRALLSAAEGPDVNTRVMGLSRGIPNELKVGHGDCDDILRSMCEYVSAKQEAS